MVSQLTLTRFDRELSNCYEAFVALDIIDVITYHILTVHSHTLYSLSPRGVLGLVLGVEIFVLFKIFTGVG